MSAPAPTTHMGLILVRRAGRLEAAAVFTVPSPLSEPEGARPCICTSGHRDRPLSSCPHCRGEGWVR